MGIIQWLDPGSPKAEARKAKYAATRVKQKARAAEQKRARVDVKAAAKAEWDADAPARAAAKQDAAEQETARVALKAAAKAEWDADAPTRAAAKQNTRVAQSERRAAQDSGAAHCAVCGAQALVSRTREIKEKKRKWRVTTGLLVRTNVLIGVDRWLECTKCKAKQ